MALTERTPEEALRSVLEIVAPGTELRDGIERIMRGETGALVVLGYDKVVESMCSGGFPIDIEFSATRLRELAKMDGAIICDANASRIVRAAVQLLPDPSIPTTESGTRHRTAERVTKQTGFPVISISQSMRMVALYVGNLRYVLENTDTIQSRATQALATLERYTTRLEEVSGMLSALEIEDLVTVRDVAVVVQRAEMVRRISDEVSGYMVELGSDGRLVALQLAELVSGLSDDGLYVRRDYAHMSRSNLTESEQGARIAALTSPELLDITRVARELGLASTGDGLETNVAPRGYRLLHKVPRLPGTVIERLTNHFGSLQALLAASVEDLQAVEGVGEQRARAIREGLSRLAESSILERYV